LESDQDQQEDTSRSVFASWH